MPEQYWLPGFHSAPRKPQRRGFSDVLFFTLFPVESAAARVAQITRRLRDQNGLTGQPFSNSRFHVSLHGFGDDQALSPATVAEARSAAASVKAPEFEVTFDRVMSFRGSVDKAPLVLRASDGCTALRAFQRSLGEALSLAGFHCRSPRSFTPHMTLCYDRCRVAEQEIEALSWTAREFFLVRSLVGKGRYIRLSRWPLRG